MASVGFLFYTIDVDNANIHYNYFIQLTSTMPIYIITILYNWRRQCQYTL
jgi:hypothetical protein